jgi:NADH-quinone oxidoreductase subunit J
MTYKDFNYIMPLTAAAVTIAFILFPVSGSAHHALALCFTGSFLSFFSTAIPAAALVFSVAVALVRHPVHSLLCLITVFFITVLLYLSVKSEFLALIFLIVYVGAIAILFLFVIMLLNVKELTSAPRKKFMLSQLLSVHFVVPCALVFFVVLSKAFDIFISKSDVIQFSTEPTAVSALINFVNYRFFDIYMFSEQLYTYYGYSFFLTALLLLTAMLGAIILASSATDAEEVRAAQLVFCLLLDASKPSQFSNVTT